MAVLVFVCAGVIRIRDTQDVFTQGVYLMGGIGLVMIAASGFAEVMRATGGVDEMVKVVGGFAGDYKGVAVFLMLFIGLGINTRISTTVATVS